jgi:hypothetical protein
VAIRGYTDDYVELTLDQGRFAGPALSRLLRRSGEVSVRRFDSGRGLAVMRVSVPQDRGIERIDWVQELVTNFQPLLPHLRLDDGTEQVNEACPEGDAAPESACDNERGLGHSEGAATHATEPDPLLRRAAFALKHDRLKDAERRASVGRHSRPTKLTPASSSV